MWEPPRSDDSKKRLRQITLAQAFQSYNKKLKSELGSSDESSISGRPPLTTVLTVPESDDDNKTDSSCEIVKEVTPPCHQGSVETDLDSEAETIPLEISPPCQQGSVEIEVDSPVEGSLATEIESTVEASLESTVDGSLETELELEVDIVPTDRDDTEFVVQVTPTKLVEPDGPTTLDISTGSLDLFPENSVPDSPSSSSTDVEESSELLSFVTSLTSRQQLGVLESSSTHSVLVKCPLSPGATPEPYPEVYFDAWDGDHVRMPCSSSNLYPVKSESGEKKIVSRWEMVQSAFSKPINCSAELREAILHYNSQYARRWNFRGIRDFFPCVLEDEETEMFFRNLLPKIVRMALSISDICTRPIPLLKRHRDHRITLSQKQIACLLANAFLCTFPRRNASNQGSEYDRYPSINFNQLFSCSPDVNKKHQKLLCILNYFRRVTTKEPTGLVTFHRQYVRHCPDWSESGTRLKRFYIQSEGTIEEEGSGMLQVDFANSFVGGGVLNTGLVQEEIRFVICPELIVSRLFTECLDTSEVLIVTGCEQYNKYSGYSNTFSWEGDFKDQTRRDEWGRAVTEIVAMDALHFTSKEFQFKIDFLRRELRKAYAGFYACDGDLAIPAVATGNWGCGVFGGDAKLKALLQYIAASEAGRDLAYFTFGEKELAKDLRKMVKFLQKKDVTVGQLWKLLAGYYEDCVAGKREYVVQLYDYVRASLG